MKRCALLFVLVVLGALAVPSACSAAGLILVPDAHWWPGPGPMPPPVVPPWPPRPRPQPYVFAPLAVNYVKVQTHITDQVAATAVDQEFYNPNPARLEGVFVFPVPKGAQLDKFTLEIDGRQVEAELLRADKARGIYEDIVRKLRDPALLEYAGQDLFKVRIFPIEPHSKKRITLSYSQLLKADGGLIGYTLPLSTEKYSAKPINQVSVKVELETKRPLKSIYSPSHAVEIKRSGPNRATAGYEASNVQPDEDFTLYFAPEKDEVGVNLLTQRTGEEDGYFVLLASPGLDVSRKQVVAKDVVFVLDTSGSMAGKKLDQAKNALRFCIENLNEGDRFEILRFSTEVEPLFDKLASADKPNREKAEAFIKDLKPMGTTAIDDALKKALALAGGSASAGEGRGSADRPLAVIFLTDGRPTIGITDENLILANVQENNRSRTRVFCFGIGTDVNTHLLDKITETTRAFSQYVLPEEDLEVKVSSFFSKIKEPVLANPTLRFTGGIRATKLYPSPLPDLFKGEQLVLVGRYSGHGDAAVVVEGSVNGAAKRFDYEVKFPERTDESRFIPRLWATRRVGYLLDEIRLHGENAELREEVTDLARQYGIVTPYTAYLIVEDEARRDVPMPMRSLRDFDRDQGARQEAARTWSQFKNDRAGQAAVADAQSGQMLKSANAPAVAAEGSAAAFRRRYGLGPAGGSANVPATTAASAPESSQTRLMAYAQQNRFVGGKNFFLNDKQWIDAAIQKAPTANRIRIAFGSPEYFDLVAKHPEALAWLALGQNVQFLLSNTVYEIHE